MLSWELEAKVAQKPGHCFSFETIAQAFRDKLIFRVENHFCVCYVYAFDSYYNQSFSNVNPGNYNSNWENNLIFSAVCWEI